MASHLLRMPSAHFYLYAEWACWFNFMLWFNYTIDGYPEDATKKVLNLLNEPEEPMPCHQQQCRNNVFYETKVIRNADRYINCWKMSLQAGNWGCRPLIRLYSYGNILSWRQGIHYHVAAHSEEQQPISNIFLMKPGRENHGTLIVTKLWALRKSKNMLFLQDFFVISHQCFFERTNSAWSTYLIETQVLKT